MMSVRDCLPYSAHAERASDRGVIDDIASTPVSPPSTAAASRPGVLCE